MMTIKCRAKYYHQLLIGCLLLSSNIFAGVGDVTISGRATADSFNGNGSEITNLSASAFYTATVVVSPVGTEIENGTALRSALSTLAGSATASSPYLLKIEPGVYHLGNTGLDMLDYVDIEGSGEDITKITSDDCNMLNGRLVGTVNGADNSELRFLTVENLATGLSCAAIVNYVTSPSLQHITVITIAGLDSYSYGIANYNAAPIISQTKVLVSGVGENHFGITNSSASPEITQTTISVSGGLNSNTGISNFSGTPVIIRSRVSVSGGRFTYGIRNEAGTIATITETIVTASEGTSSNTGVANIFDIDLLTIAHSKISASDGGTNYGIRFAGGSSSAILSDVIAIAIGGTTNYGLFNDSRDFTIYNIDYSTFEGSTASIYGSTRNVFDISSSKLLGSTNSVGSFNCVDVTSDNGSGYVATDENCIAP